MQRLIDFFNTETLILSFASVIRPALIELMKDINGNHIILKFFNVIDLSFTEFAYDIINQNLTDISLHKNGCCSIQKCLENSDPMIKKIIIENIIENCLILITDPYGNYVVQNVIYLRDFEYNKKIILNLMKDIVFFSKQKYSSNVVEKVKLKFIN
jgi:pumilio RNA-binding family